MKSLALSILALSNVVPSLNIKKATTTTNYSYKNDFDLILIEPYSQGGKPKIEVKASFYKDILFGNGTKNFHYVAYYPKEDYTENFHTATSSTFDYSETITFTPKYYDDEIEITIYAFIVAALKFSRTCKLTKTERKRVYYTATTDGVYTPSGYSYCYTNKNGEKPIQEKFTFNNFSGYHIRAYNAIDFSNFSFYYNSGGYYDFSYSTAYILFPNVEHELDALGEKSGENFRKFKILIKYNKLTTLANIVLNESFFVDPVTMKMSSKEEVGYAKTTSLYITSNTIMQLMIRQFAIVIENAGFNKNTYYMTMNAYKKRYIFGLFANADYKICSENATPDFAMGEVYKHNND